jgi:hypothetical protein
MFHRIAIWRVFVTLGSSTFSTKSADSGHLNSNDKQRGRLRLSGRFSEESSLGAYIIPA